MIISVKAKKKILLVSRIALLVYMALLVYLLFFAEEYGRISGDQVRYNLMPMQEIVRFLKYHETVGGLAAFLNIAGNVIGFVPFGLLLPILYKHLRTGLWVVLFGFLISLGVEGIQLLTRVGIFDVDDLLLNTCGTALGYLLFTICNQFRLHHRTKK